MVKEAADLLDISLLVRVLEAAMGKVLKHGRHRYVIFWPSVYMIVKALVEAKALKPERGLTQAEICVKTGLRKATVSRAIRRLKESGAVKQEKGRWHIALSYKVS